MKRKLARELERGDRCPRLVNAQPLVEVSDNQPVVWSKVTLRRVVCHSPRGDEYHAICRPNWLVEVEERPG